MWKTERNGENWFIGHLQRPNGNHHRIDDDDELPLVYDCPLRSLAAATSAE